MGKQRRTKLRKAAAKRSRTRTANRSSQASRPHERERMYDQVGLVPYCRVAHPPTVLQLATDGTVSDLVSFTGDPDELAYVVLDDSGLLRQMLLVINGRSMPESDEQFIDRFRRYRASVGEQTPDLPTPSRWCPAIGRVRFFKFDPYAPAFNGTRSILVSEFGDDKAVLVIDDRRLVIDQVSIGEAEEASETGYYSDALLDFLARRSEVGDPMVSDESEPDDTPAAEAGGR